MPSGANSKAKCEMSMVRSDAGRPLSRPRLAPSASLHGEIIYMYGVAAEVVSKEAVSDLRDRSGAGVERRPCRFCCVRHACDRIYVGAGGGAESRCGGRHGLCIVQLGAGACPPFPPAPVAARPLVSSSSPLWTHHLSRSSSLFSHCSSAPVAGRPKFGPSPTGLHFTSLHFIKARAGQRTPAALSDSYTGPYIYMRPNSLIGAHPATRSTSVERGSAVWGR